MAAGAGRIPEPWGCSASQLQETPSSQHWGGAVPLLPFGSQACLAQLPQHMTTFEALQPSSSCGARPAGKGCHWPLSQGQPAGHSLEQSGKGAAATESLLCHCCLELQTHQDTPAAMGSTSQHWLLPCTGSTRNAGGGRAPHCSWKKTEGPRCLSMWGGCACWQQCPPGCCPCRAG